MSSIQASAGHFGGYEDPELLRLEVGEIPCPPVCGHDILHDELSGDVVCFSLPQSCLNGLAGVEELPIRFTNHLNNYSAIQISNHIGEFLKDLTYVRFTVH